MVTGQKMAKRRKKSLIRFNLSKKARLSKAAKARKKYMATVENVTDISLPRLIVNDLPLANPGARY